MNCKKFSKIKQKQIVDKNLDILYNKGPKPNTNALVSMNRSHGLNEYKYRLWIVDSIQK